MIVAAIIGVLAVIVVPKFADMVVKAKEAAVLGKLGTVRSAFMLYYGDTEGIWPECTLSPLGGSSADGLIGRYLDDYIEIELPRARTAGGFIHRGRYMYSSGGAGIPWPTGPERPVTDVYFTEEGPLPIGSAWGVSVGSVWINCSHTDSKGRLWSSY
jgi:type II secretory pathway pseudopilin PulG